MGVALLNILVGYVSYEKEKTHRHASLQTYLQKQFDTVGSSSDEFPLKQEQDFINAGTMGANVTQFTWNKFIHVHKCSVRWSTTKSLQAAIGSAEDCHKYLTLIQQRSLQNNYEDYTCSLKSKKSKTTMNKRTS